MFQSQNIRHIHLLFVCYRGTQYVREHNAFATSRRARLRMRFLHCVTIFNNKAKVSYKKSQCKVVNACGNRMCKFSFTNETFPETSRFLFLSDHLWTSSSWRVSSRPPWVSNNLTFFLINLNTKSFSSGQPIYLSSHILLSTSVSALSTGLGV